MPSVQTVNELLKEQGIAIVTPIYSAAEIADWNKIFTPILEKQDAKRRYISALALHNLGLLDKIFSQKLQSLLLTLIPDAELYHCHVYEIAGNQTTPHISANNKLDGWHRDVDCKHHLLGEYVQHISLFVYLSDVKDNGGYFEVSNKKCYPVQYGNQDTHYQLIGNAGTCFLFDRKAYHRASPNYSSTPRRVLKLSIQSRALFNHKQQEQIFIDVRRLVKNESHGIRQLFGDKSVTATVEKYGLNAEIPTHSCASNFTPYQNFLRMVRDVNFISRRLGASLGLVDDQKRPKPKIT